MSSIHCDFNGNAANQTCKPIYVRLNDVPSNRTDSSIYASQFAKGKKTEGSASRGMRIEREMFRAVTRHARASGAARVSRGSFSRILTTTTLSQLRQEGCFEGRTFRRGFRGEYARAREERRERRMGRASNTRGKSGLSLLPSRIFIHSPNARRAQPHGNVGRPVERTIELVYLDIYS